MQFFNRKLLTTTLKKHYMYSTTELSIADFGEELTASFSEYYPTRLGRFGLVDRLVDRKHRVNSK